MSPAGKPESSFAGASLFVQRLAKIAEQSKLLLLGECSFRFTTWTTLIPAKWNGSALRAIASVTGADPANHDKDLLA
jgi:hypothetical protein